MKHTIKEVAESLIGRTLGVNDGIDKVQIEQAEIRLGLKLPEVLREFYALVGNLDIFTSSFESFAPLEEMECENDMLIFLYENQGGCCWGLNLHEVTHSTVYMCTDTEAEKPEWYPEEITLDKFLKIIMYLQCAEGGYEYGCAVYEHDFEGRKEYEEFLSGITVGWEKVVDYNGFVSYQKDTKLIWYFSDNEGKMEDILYASAYTEDNMEELLSIGFSEL